MTMYSKRDAPAWLDGDKIDEVLFCEEFVYEHPMICIHECFFTADGKVTDESWIKNLIYEKLKPYIRRGISRKVTGLLDVLRAECYSPPLPVYHDRIHVANGRVFLDGHFDPAKEFCLNRLPVAYNPDAKKPEHWLRFLDEKQMIGAFEVPLLRNGFRLVVFSLIIMIVVLFFRKGIMGTKELPDLFRRKKKEVSAK